MSRKAWCSFLCSVLVWRSLLQTNQASVPPTGRAPACGRAAAPPSLEARVESALEHDRVRELQPPPGTWTLEKDGFELLTLPMETGEPEKVALEAGVEMSVLASKWRPIKNGDESLGRRQSYLRMRKHRAPLGLNAAAVLQAAERAVRERLGPDFVMNDCVAIADFDPNLPRQELHRDIRRDALECSTHGLLAPLAPGARLHVVPGSHEPRGALRGSFSRKEVLALQVQPGQMLLWDGMLVHAGDGGLPQSRPGSPNRLRLHSYVEREGEDRPYDDKGDRGIMETE